MRLTVNVPSQNLIERGRFIFDYSSFKISFLHDFGNDNVKEKRIRLAVNEDEKNRIR